MRTSLRATIAIATALGVLLVAAVAGARSPGSESRSAMEDGSGGGPAAMCIEGVPDCNDTPEIPDGDSVPGWDGEGDPPSTGLPGDDIAEAPPCGVEIVEGDGPDGTVSYTPCPGDEPLPTEPQPQIVEPTPGMSNVFARPFDTASVGDDGRTITLDFWAGIEPCSVLDHVDVRFGDHAVTITLHEGNDLSGGEDVACIEIAVLKRVVITLGEPLGDRRIVDGAASKGGSAA